MNTLHLLFKSKEPTEADILNAGLKLTIRLGVNNEDLIKSILINKFPFLTDDELMGFEKEYKGANDFGHNFPYMTMVKRCKDFDAMSGSELLEVYESAMAKKYPWVSKSNLRSIYAKVCYGLFHDGWNFKKD